MDNSDNIPAKPTNSEWLTHSYPADGPRIDIIRLTLKAVLNQSRYVFNFTP